MPSVSETTTRLHYEIVRGLLDDGACPSNAALAERLQIGPAEFDEAMHALAAIHGVVLHPHVCEPWVVHPFSVTPTLNFVQGPNHGWWAPCIWCAFGVATLAGGEVEIHTRIGAETSPLVLKVKDGEPDPGADLLVHFAIPPSRAWDNVHQHCALVLPFRSATDISDWCVRHCQPRGEPVPLHQVAQLARIWYGRHARPDWKKWSVAEAREIFYQAGLRSAFWDLGAQTGRF